MSMISDININIGNSKSSDAFTKNDSFHSYDSRKENAFIPTNYLQESKTAGDNDSVTAILSKEDLLTGADENRDTMATVTLGCRNDTIKKPVKRGRVSAILSKEDLMKDADDRITTATTNSSKAATTIATEGIMTSVSPSISGDNAAVLTDAQLSTTDVNATIYNQSDNKSNDNESITDSEDEDLSLYFIFREKKVPVRYQSYLTQTAASNAISSRPFRQWVSRTSRIIGTKCFNIHYVIIDSIYFGCDTQRDVESMNITAHCTMDDEDLRLRAQRVPGNCSLKGDSIGILVNLRCVEDDTKWSILVDRPRCVGP